jgi:hypothetical protein
MGALAALAACAAAGLPAARAAEEKPLRLFILAGQSNMAGLKPEAGFTPAATAAFPDDEILVVKVAFSGTPIRLWYKDWKAPEGWKEPPPRKRADGRESAEASPEAYGRLYDILIGNARGKLGTKTPRSVTFIWMQGERDAKSGTESVYLESLQGLIRKLRADLGRPDTTVVIGRLSDHQLGQPGWDAVRAAQEKAAAADPLAAWVDSDDLNGPKNDLHLPPEGYAELGRRFAQKAAELIRRQATAKPAP